MWKEKLTVILFGIEEARDSVHSEKPMAAFTARSLWQLVAIYRRPGGDLR